MNCPQCCLLLKDNADDHHCPSYHQHHRQHPGYNDNNDDENEKASWDHSWVNK